LIPFFLYITYIIYIRGDGVKFKKLIITILQSFNPSNYEKLVARRKRKAITYFCLMSLCVFVITSVLMIPSLLTLPSYLSDEINKFSELKVNIDYEQKEPVYLTKNMPIITIDTVNEHEHIEEGTLLISKNKVHYRLLPFGKGTTRETSEENSLQGVNILLTILFVAALPVLLVGVFLYGVIKYLVFIAIVATLGFVFARIIRFGLSFREVFNISIFAGTPLVVLGLLSKPFVPSLGYLEYLAFFVYFLLGAVQIGEFEHVSRPSKAKKDDD
jgi:hypothetical protein